MAGKKNNKNRHRNRNRKNSQSNSKNKNNDSELSSIKVTCETVDENDGVQFFFVNCDTKSLVAVKKEHLGLFDSTKSYVAFIRLQTPSKNNDDGLMAYIWHGVESSSSSKIELVGNLIQSSSNDLTGSWIQMNQGYEHDSFIQLLHEKLQKSLIVGRSNDESRYFRVVQKKSNSGQMLAKAVELVHKSSKYITSHDCIVCHNSNDMSYLWMGENTNDDHRNIAYTVAIQITKDQNALIKMTQGSEMDEFWEKLQGEKTEMGNYRPETTPFTYNPILVVRSSDDDTSWQQTYNYKQEDLQHLALLDNGVDTFLWAQTEKNVSLAESCALIKLYWLSNDVEEDEIATRSIGFVCEKHESNMFVELFGGEWKAQANQTEEAEEAAEITNNNVTKSEDEEAANFAAEQAAKVEEEKLAKMAAEAEVQPKAEEQAAELVAIAAEADAQDKEEEVAKLAAEANTQGKAEGETAELAAIAAAADAQVKAEQEKAEEEEAAKLVAEAEAQAKAEEEAAELAATAAEADTQAKAEEEKAAKAEEEEAAKLVAEAEAQAKAEEEAAELAAEVETQAKAEEEKAAKLAAEAEDEERAKLAAEEEKEAASRATAEAVKAKAEEEERAKLVAEAELQAKAEEEKLAKAEEEEAAKLATEAKTQAEEKEAARIAAEKAAKTEEEATKLAAEADAKSIEVTKTKVKEEEVTNIAINTAAVAIIAGEPDDAKISIQNSTTISDDTSLNGIQSGNVSSSKEKEDKKADEEISTSEDKKTYSLEELLEPTHGVEWAKREEYLSNEDFLEKFQMPIEEFRKLATWKRQKMKKRLSLF